MIGLTLSVVESASHQTSLVSVKATNLKSEKTYSSYGTKADVSINNLSEKTIIGLRIRVYPFNALNEPMVRFRKAYRDRLIDNIKIGAGKSQTIKAFLLGAFDHMASRVEIRILKVGFSDHTTKEYKAPDLVKWPAGINQFFLANYSRASW